MIRFLIEKEFKLIRRNTFLPRMIIMMPIMMMCILPFAANMDVKNINFAVVDNDHSVYSTQLINKINSSGYFILNDYAVSFEEAMKGIEEGSTDIILEIPRYFGRDMLSIDNIPQLYIAVNTVNATKASMGSGYMATIVQSFVAANSVDKITPAVNITSQNRFNPFLNYKYFMVPALMVMLLTIMCGFMPALNIVSEKEKGTIEQINVTPVGRFAFIFSKIVPYWIIGFIVLTICFGIAFLVYGLSAVGSYSTIYLTAFLFILTVSGIGLVVSNYSSTMQQAMFVMYFFMLLMILLSGLFTPIQSMPQWAKYITIFNPLKYFIQIMRGVYLKGSTVSDIWLSLSALGLFALSFNTWAMISYRKKE